MQPDLLIMRPVIFLLISIIFTECTVSATKENTKEGVGDISFWLTTGDKKHLLQNVPDLSFIDEAKAGTIISIDTTQTFQTIDGFGYSLTGGSADLIHQKLNEEDRQALLRE